MNKFTAILALMLLVTVAPGFSMEEPPHAAEARPHEPSILPRAVGSTWEYRGASYKDGKVDSTGVSRERVVKAVVIDGVECFRMHFRWDDRTMLQRLTGADRDLAGSSHAWEYQDEKGVHEFMEDEDAPKPPTSLKDFNLTFKYPAEKGLKYLVDQDPYAVLDTAREVKVPAGDFTCVVYEATYADAEDPEFSSRERFFLSPGVGVVRWEMDEKNEAGQWALSMTEVLTRYSPKLQEPKAEEAKPKDDQADSATPSETDPD